MRAASWGRILLERGWQMDTPESDNPKVKKGFIYADPEKNRAALFGILGGVIVLSGISIVGDGISLNELCISSWLLLPALFGGVAGRSGGTLGSIIVGGFYVILTVVILGGCYHVFRSFGGVL